MADELRLALILLGTLAIGAVILHGIWTVRKTVNEEKKLAKAKQDEQVSQPEEVEEDAKAANLHQMEMDFNQLAQASKEQGLPVADMDVDSIYQTQEDDTETETVKQLDVASEEPEVKVEQVEDVTHESLVDEQVEPVLQSFSAIDDHPVEVEEISIAPDLDEPELVLEPSEPEPDLESTPQEVLMLFVDKKDGEPIDGAKLLPILLTLGFKFGEMEFFHRHEDNSGKGEVLFSLANMYNPGTFDIDKMEQVTTRGLTIFMTLPNAAEPLQTFNMMHNAAKKIADEFSAEVLDNNRQPLDVGRVRNYVEKIRKFQV